MPELPEIECLRQSLEREVPKGVRISKWILNRKDLRFPLPMDLLRKTESNEILSFQRRAKYLIIETKNHFVISHLGMSGTWRWEKGQSLKHDHVELCLSNGQRLIYNDPRRFGFIEVIKRQDRNQYFADLGPEPILFDSSIKKAGISGNNLYFQANAKEMHEGAAGRETPIKQYLMDQKVIVGVGNIYANESLFLAGISPLRPAGRLSFDEWSCLLKVVQKVLREAVKRGGSSIRDYKSLSRGEGGFQKNFKVYGREGLPCFQCKDSLSGVQLGGRQTVWCSHCQK